jgi:hypothetical protein
MFKFKDIFDYVFFKNDNTPIIDEPLRSTIDVTNPTTKTSSIVKTLVVRLHENYKKFTQGRSVDLAEPDVTLTTIKNAIKVESYLRRCRDRYVELIWKNGYDFVGKNQVAVDYVKRRFKEIAYVTQKPTQKLFEDISSQLILFYNCFIYKARDQKSSSGKPRDFFNKTVQPVAGYYVWDCTKINIRIDQKKRLITEYEYTDDRIGTTYQTVVPFTDMIHMIIDKAVDGFFGVPAAISVLDDIRALRRMEENVEILVFQHTIPLIQYQVGTPEIPCQDGEIDMVRSEVENMVAQGMLVTPERHKIEAIGAQREALDVVPYLEYFKARILTGLGQSSVSLGEGGSSNRATAQTISQSVIDAAIRFQTSIKTYINEFMINELLMEGGFDVFSNDDNKVELFLPEIDLDSKIRKEYHCMQLYQGGLLDENEARVEIGRKPFEDAQRVFTYFELVTLPTIVAQAQAKATVAGAASGTSASRQAKQGASRSVPTNQYGTKKVGPNKRIDMLDSTKVVSDDLGGMIDEYGDKFRMQYYYTLDDILSSLNEKSFTSGKIALHLTQDMVSECGSQFIIAAYKAGINRVGFHDQITVDADLKIMHMAHTDALTRFFVDMIDRVDKSGRTDEVVTNIFESQEYRIRFIVDWFLKKSYWMGVASALQAHGRNPIKLKHTNCEKCNENPKEIKYDELHIDMIPPYHANCDCEIEL